MSGLEILKTVNLSKKYKGHSVVKNMNMTINKGEIYGFLGQNGAGKTTTIRMIMGLIKPSSGEIHLFNKKVNNPSQIPFERIGAIIETPGFYNNLTGYENLDIHRRYMNIYNKEYIDEALEIVGLIENKHRKVKDYSLGMKQRLGIARALLHKPELLILDEPTNGLDPKGIREIRELIHKLAEFKKITILISSHILSEIQQMATKIGIIHRGELLEEISSEQISKRNRKYLQLVIDNANKASVVLEQKLGIYDYHVENTNIIRVYERIDESDEITRVLVNEGISIKQVNLTADTLEDYFLKLTEGVAL